MGSCECLKAKLNDLSGLSADEARGAALFMEHRPECPLRGFQLDNLSPRQQVAVVVLTEYVPVYTSDTPFPEERPDFLGINPN